MKLYNTNKKSIYSLVSLKKYFSVKTLRKDYYAILGISKSSTNDQIKLAYRNLAKIYHPDVNTLPDSSTHEPSLQKFREIAEAYAVLSNPKLKIEYDVKLNNYPELVFNKEKLKNMDESRKERDNSGNNAKPLRSNNSYADFRLEKLKEVRKKFNVDDHGFTKGGVPRPYQGNIRQNSLYRPGLIYSAFEHNELYEDRPSTKPLSTEEVVAHQVYMNGI